ncbi:SPOC like C-terminal domain-containing protein [Lipomyces japonicus]|uniref:SPOC like C-terminal domain-containing protein n=1 Tax=Lipomyces japonicus TaxID=56871 RepID=UPI0034CD77A9
MAEKACTIYVVDQSPSMTGRHLPGLQAAEDGNDNEVKNNLQLVLEYLQDKIGSKIYSNRKTDVVGIVGVGTATTDNVVSNDDQAGYDHITAHFGIRQFMASDFRQLRDKLVAGDFQGDIVSGIVVAIQMISLYCRHLKYVKRIVVLSNLNADLGLDDEDEYAPIAQKLADERIGVEVLCVGNAKDSSQQQQQNWHTVVPRFLQFAKQCGMPYGESHEFEAVMRELRDVPLFKTVRSVATYSGMLTLGGSNKGGENHHDDARLAIEVERFAHTKIAAAMNSTAYAVSAEADDGVIRDISHEIRYKVRKQRKDDDHDDDSDEEDKENDDEFEVGKQDLQKGYIYGATVVPISHEDEQNLQFRSDKSYEIVGFVSRATVKPWELMSETSYVVGHRKNARAQFALASLARAMEEYEYCAVARLVSKPDSRPVMMLLMPEITAAFSVLVDVRLPFAEDCRKFRFRPLNEVRVLNKSNNNGTEIVTENHYLLPTPELVTAMDAYVDALDVTDAQDADVDALDVDVGRPGMVANPVIAHVQRCVEARAVSEDAVDKIPDRFVSAFSRVPDRLLTAAAKQVAKLQAAADVKPVPKFKSNKRKYAGVKAEDENEPATSRRAGINLDQLMNAAGGGDDDEDEGKDDLDIADEISKWLSRPADEDPRSERLTQILTEAGNQIMQMAKQARDGGNGRKVIMSKIKRLRYYADTLEEPEIYDDFVGKLRQVTNNNELWQAVCAQGFDKM